MGFFWGDQNGCSYYGVLLLVQILESIHVYVSADIHFFMSRIPVFSDLFYIRAIYGLEEMWQWQQEGIEVSSRIRNGRYPDKKNLLTKVLAHKKTYEKHEYVPRHVVTSDRSQMIAR
mmetsp:Transcript_41909/g.67234  ORF Transcript_41909/g.67234 Transcript_41909/m.67234 type:complete len:117 (+) Transcript_41909:1306-1656(+)